MDKNEKTQSIVEIMGSLSADTIHANLYFRNCFHFSLRTRFYFLTELYKLKFRILNRTTIVCFEEHYIDKEFPYPETRNDTLHFWKSSQLPPPYTEMKKKRWLWQNKKDWKKYKEKKKIILIGS